jgi:hypothetical protein
MLRTFIQVISVTFSLIATKFLINGALGLSLKDMVELSLTKFGANTKILRNLSDNRVNTMVGFIFILLSFIFQTINLLWPLRAIDFEINRHGVWLALGFSLACYFIASYITKRLHRNIFNRVEIILDERLKR